MKILVAEDDRSLSRALEALLEHEGHDVDTALDGELASNRISDEAYDAIVMDIMMPKRTGLEVLSEMRANGNETPVLLLTALSDIDDKLEGLETGANDYLPKPFDSRELVARIKAITRNVHANDPIRIGDTEVDDGTMSVGETTVFIDSAETEITRLLASAGDEPVRTQKIMKRTGLTSDAVVMKVSFLNEKLASIGSGMSIEPHGDEAYRISATRHSKNPYEM